jgi:hypothetical protein
MTRVWGGGVDEVGEREEEKKHTQETKKPSRGVDE